MATPLGAIDSDIQEIQALLDQGVRARRFRPGLEQDFQAHVRRRTLDVIRASLLVTIAAFILLGVLTWLQLTHQSRPGQLANNARVWWQTFPAEAVVVAALLTLPWIPALNRRFRFSIGVISGSSIVLVTVAASAFADPYFNVYTSYLVILVILLVYGLGGMTLLDSTLVSWLAAIVALFVIELRGLWFDPVYFGAYVALANFVGMLLGYLLELRDRVMFLQARLLQLEKARLNAYAEQVARLSREDALTGLANRRHFNDTLQKEWDRARRHHQNLALIFVDIDHFKPFNDNHGHVEGDRALTEVAQALGRVLRRPADLAARYGGEEFVLLLPNTTAAGAAELGEQARQAVAALAIAHRASRVADHVTASVGVASLVPADDGDYSRLIHAADEAAYAAKAAGRNRVVVAAV